LVIKREWWIEKEINPINNNLLLFDEILQQIYDNFIIHHRADFITWHFFRENYNIRVRFEFHNREVRDKFVTIINDLLDSIDIINKHYFANHGRRIENLDDGYPGEQETYGRLWFQQKKLWEWGSEMAIGAYKEYLETGDNFPHRSYQLKRVFHLLSNQLHCIFNEGALIFQERSWDR